MIYSNEDKIKKAAWLYKSKEYMFTSLQLQKFLFFYEMFSKVNDEEYDIDRLCAYERGPVFTPVYGDFNYRKKTFLEKLEETMDFSGLNKKIARVAKMIIESMTDDEISDLTHILDLWSIHEEEIEAGKKHVSIKDKEITEKDEQILINLYEYYSRLDDLNFKHINVNNKVFMMKDEILERIEANHYPTLVKLSREDSLINPVFIDIEIVNKKEVLLVD